MFTLTNALLTLLVIFALIILFDVGVSVGLKRLLGGILVVVFVLWLIFGFGIR